MIKSVLKDGLIYGVSSIISRGVSMLTLPFYARALSTEAFGALELIITFGALISLTVALEIHQGLIRQYSDLCSPKEKIDYVSTAFWFTVAMYALFTFVSFVFSEQICLLLLGSNLLLPSFQLGILLIVSNSLFYFIQCQFRTELRSMEYALLSILYTSLTFILSVLLAYFHNHGLEGLIFGQLTASTISIIIGIIRLKKSINFIFKKLYLLEMLKFSLPLVPSGIATFMCLYSNRLALNSYTSLEDIGIFGMGIKIAGIAGLMMFGIQSAITPLVYTHYKKRETPSQLAKLFEWFVAGSILICLSLGLFAKELLQIFVTSQYVSAAPIVLLLAPALLLNQMYIFAPGMAIEKKMHWQLWITLSTSLVSISLNYAFVIQFGYIGAAWATLITSFLYATLYISASQKLYPIPFHWRKICFSVCISIFISIASFINYFELSLMVRLCLLLVPIVSFFQLKLVTRLDIMKLYRTFRLRSTNQSNII